MYSSCGDTFQHVRCLFCGHIYLSPRPTASAASIIYPDNHLSFAGTIAKSIIMSRVKKFAILRRLRSLLTTAPRVRILEIGFGDGELLLGIRGRLPDAELEGLDFHVHPDVARDLRSKGIRLIEGMAEDVRLNENYYDLIIMNQLIEHLWDVDKVLQDCLKALKPSGFLSIETPDSAGYDRYIFRKGLWGSYYYPRHLNLFSQSGLRKVLERTGFQVVKNYNTVAPVCWVFTMNSIAGRYPAWCWLRKIFTVTNVAPIAVFTLIDLLALGVRFHSSNQRVVARRVARARRDITAGCSDEPLPIKR